MDLQQLYTDLILEYNRYKTNKRKVEAPTVHELGHNPSCGDDIFLKLKTEGDVIADGAFVGDGCAISQASADIMLGMVIGQPKEKALQMADTFMRMIKGEASEAEIDSLEEASALRDISHMPARVKCAVLGWRTLKEAVGK